MNNTIIVCVCVLSHSVGREAERQKQVWKNRPLSSPSLSVSLQMPRGLHSHVPEQKLRIL